MFWAPKSEASPLFARSPFKVFSESLSEGQKSRGEKAKKKVD